MPLCNFCKRDDIPRVPGTPLDIAILVAHVDADGVTCLEGTSQEAHSKMLEDYPRDEMLYDPNAWLFDVVRSIPDLTTVHTVDRIAQVTHAPRGEEPAFELPDVEPPKAVRKRRKSRDKAI